MTKPVNNAIIVVASVVILLLAYAAYLYYEPRAEFRAAKKEVTAAQLDYQNHTITFSRYMDKIKALAEEYNYSEAYVSALFLNPDNPGFGQFVRSKRDLGQISADEYERFMKTEQAIVETATKRKKKG
jgi:hypothetical protein